MFPIYWFLHEIRNLKTIGEPNPVCGDIRFDLMTRPGEAAVQICYFIFVTYACFLVWLGILRKGLNKEIKKVILRRYIRY